MFLRIKHENGQYIVEYPSTEYDKLYCNHIFDEISSATEIAKIFSNIPKHFRSVSFSKEFKGISTRKYFDKLIYTLPYLPKTIKSINCACMAFHRFSAKELAKIFAAIPSHVISLNLSTNGLFSYNALVFNAWEVYDRAKALKSALLKFPKNVHLLLLANNAGEESYIDNIQECFSAIPKTVTKLDISCSKFLQISKKNAKHFFSSLPATVNTIDWSSNKCLIMPRLGSLGKWDMEILADILSSLPNTVTSLNLSSNELFWKTGDELGKIFSKLPQGLKELKLYDNKLDSKKRGELANILSSLPHSLESLDLASYCRVSTAYLEAILSQLPSNIHSLSLRSNFFGTKNGAELVTIFSTSSRGITSIDLSDNALARISGADLKLGFSRLPSNVTALNLSENEFGEKSKAELMTVFSNLPSTITSLDLSANKFARINKLDLAEIFLNLSSGINSLKLRRTYRPLDNNDADHMATTIESLPLTITSLDLGENDLFITQDNDLAKIFSKMPMTIQCLDLSCNRFNLKASSQLKEAFIKLPKTLKELKLCGNDLDTLSLVELKEIFSGIGPSITTLDLSDNDLENLPLTKFNALLSMMPDTIIRVKLGHNKITLRNDGKLVLQKEGKYTSTLFKQVPDALVHQAKFIELRLPMLQWISTKKICSDVVCVIMSFLLNESPLTKLKMFRKLHEPILPIRMPQGELREVAQQKSLQAVKLRLAALSQVDEMLDLSRCGLNRIYDLGMLVEMLNEIPKTVSVLKLRGNGFTENNGAVIAIRDILRIIPKKIYCLDLSDNGLEFLNGAQLQALFVNLPKTVTLITLNQTQPISPVHLIAQKHWPQYYQEIIKPSATPMQNAEAVLKNYVEKPFDFCYFMQGKGCEPPYIDEVKTLIRRIDAGEIEHVADLIEAIEEINAMNNENHALMKRLRFIENIGSQPTNNTAVTQAARMY